MKGLVEDLDKRSEFVEKERSRRELAPTDILPFEALKPADEPDAAERLEKLMHPKGLVPVVAAKRGKGKEEEESEE